ncbi:MAG TPA: ABC transporter ATP-binding protein [Thermoanaerobaculia bacterium]|nr:ABC transporter ATP-binding protein [Thermoanaerobaculia bacterium]
MNDYLRLDGVSKRYGEIVAVRGVSLSLHRGELLALLGPSGSGKTTILRLLSGFETTDEGRILVDGEDITALRPVDRRFGMVFQHYALFPHLDVAHNVAFGLRSLGVRGRDLDGRVDDALALVDLRGFEKRRVHELSGGQQQRVALARALAPEPRVLLLDEPLSNLDPSLREKTRLEMRDLVRRVGITTILVTHEQEEAFALGDRIALLRDGRLEQAGTAEQLYASPASRFVAGFIGRASGIEGEILARREREIDVRVENAVWTLPADSAPSSDRVILMIRPEALRLVPSNDEVLTARITARRFSGAQAFYHLRTGRGVVLEVAVAPSLETAGDQVGLVPVVPGVHLFPQETD